MAKKYTKREFLKLLGLSVVMLPFIGCFDLDSKSKSSDKEKEKPEVKDATKNKGTQQQAEPEIKVTDDDVLLLTRNDALFAKLKAGFNKRIHKLPKYIAVCKTEKGVQFAIQKARIEGLKVAVKSGGHSFEGFSSNDGGLVINLSLMKKITWLDNHFVRMEPGCLLQEIQDATFSKKRLLPAGSCGTVGIAGLTLGGGYGFFSRKYGLTCDCLSQIRMVGADGKVYDSDKNKELLWASKGGGNGNFGVVTSFKFKTFEMPAYFCNYVLKFRQLNADKASSILDQWFELTDALPLEAFAAYVLNGNTITVLITNFRPYSGFEKLFETLSNQADSFYPHPKQRLPRALKKYYGRKGPIYFKNASAGMYRNQNDIKGIQKELLRKVMDSDGFIYQIDTLGGNIINPEFEKNACYPHREKCYISELQAYWENPEQEAGRIKSFEAIQNLIKANGISAHYRNYPDIQFENWESAYYGSNYAHLQTIKKLYDPDDLFHFPQSIRLP